MNHGSLRSQITLDPEVIPTPCGCGRSKSGSGNVPIERGAARYGPRPIQPRSSVVRVANPAGSVRGSAGGPGWRSI